MFDTRSHRFNRQVRILSTAVATVFVLQSLVGCQPPSRTYAIESATVKSAMGDLEFTAFSEVLDATVCDVATKAADKGIRDGSPSGKTTPSSRQSNCVTELPAELQKVERGERLPGAFIIKTAAPPGPPGYSVFRGFPIDNPEVVCRMLTDRMKERTRNGGTTLTCQYPLEITSVRAAENDGKIDGHD